MFDLKEIRKAAGMSGTALAAAMGLSPVSGRQQVTQIEARDDWLLSRLARYIAAAGGTAELVVRVDGQELIFPIVEG